MNKIMLIFSCLIFLNIVAGECKKELSVEERQLFLERATLFYEYRENKKAQAQLNRNITWKDNSKDFSLMGYFLSEEYAETPDSGVSEHWSKEFEDKQNKKKYLSYRKKNGLVEEYSIYTLEKSQNSITPDKYNTHVAHYEMRFFEGSQEVKTINDQLQYRAHKAIQNSEENKYKKTKFGIEGIPNDILRAAENSAKKSTTSAHESIIKRDSDKQFVERWACPKILYPFVWLIYGEKVAESRSWLWSEAKPTSYYEQEDKKVEKNSLAEQFRDQYRQALAKLGDAVDSGFIYVLYSNVSQNLPYDGLREHLHEFHVALDSFNKLVKDKDPCDAIKKKRQVVVSRFDGYVTNKDSYYDYNAWKSNQKVADKDVYSFKSFYNAHEELARTAKNLTDHWVGCKMEELNGIPVTAVSKKNIENQKKALHEKHADMFQTLQRYGVNQQILQKVGFEEKKECL